VLCTINVFALTLFSAYSPPWMGLDAWFIKADGVWHQFQLAGPMPGQLDKPWPPIGDPDRGPSKGHEQGLFHSTSTDLIKWEDRGVVLTVGPRGAWDDGLIYTGNIVAHEGKYYLFYTGIPYEHRPDAPCLSPIGVAVSDDLENWTKHPDNPVLVPDPAFYAKNGDWRDCNFYWHEAEGVWYAVITATAATDEHLPAGSCIGLARSKDLIHWECLPPLAGAQRYRLGMENPFLFEQDGIWFTGHSMYSEYFHPDWLEANPDVVTEGGLYYYTADTMHGPYTFRGGIGLQPDPPPYACQFIRWDADTRLFIHRGPARWATSLPKQVAFDGKGGMALRYWPGVEKARKESLLTLDGTSVSGGSGDPVTVGVPGLDCFFEATVTLAPGARASMSLGDTFSLVCDREAGSIYATRPGTTEPRHDRRADHSLDKPVRMRLVAEGSVVEVFADDMLLFMVERPKLQDDIATAHAGDGAVVGEIVLDQLDTGNRQYQYGFNY
jgi:beta-fructofuranosidase